MARNAASHTDDFNRSDRDLDNDNDWLMFNSGWPATILSQTCSATHPNTTRGSYVATITNPNQWCKIRVQQVPIAGDNISPNLRMTKATGHRYEGTVTTTFIDLWKVGAGGNGFISGVRYMHTLAVDDEISMETEDVSNGVAVTVYLDATPIISYTDTGQQYGAAITSGNPGINKWQPNGGVQGQMDDWEAGTLSPLLRIIDVNGGTYIKTGNTIRVKTNDNANVISGELTKSGFATITLTLLGIVDDYVEFQAIDVKDTEFAPITGCVVEVSTAGETDTVAVDVVMLDTEAVFLVADAAPNGLANGIAVQDGDMLGQTTIDGTTIEWDANGHRGLAIYDPAVPNGTTATRLWYSTSGKVWDTGPMTINQDATATVPLEWKGTPAPHNAELNAQYDYAFGHLVVGTRPLEYTVAEGALPAGLSLDDTAEKITGVPTEDGTFTGIKIQVNYP